MRKEYYKEVIDGGNSSTIYSKIGIVMRKIFDVLVRIILLIPVLIINLVFSTYKALYMTTMFLLHGGEFIAYNKFDRTCIYDLYQQLKELDKDTKDEN